MNRSHAVDLGQGKVILAEGTSVQRPCGGWKVGQTKERETQYDWNKKSRVEV